MATVEPQTRLEYQKTLESCRHDHSAVAIPNRWPWQSKLAICELAKEAVQRQAERLQSSPSTAVIVRILTSTFPDCVYGGETARLLERFCRSGGVVRLLVWNDTLPKCDDPFLGSLKADKKNFKLSGILPTNEIPHLMAVEKSAYRLENPHSTVVSEFSDFTPEVPARICFNDDVLGETVVAYFEAVWAALTEIQSSNAPASV